VRQEGRCDFCGLSGRVSVGEHVGPCGNAAICEGCADAVSHDFFADKAKGAMTPPEPRSPDVHSRLQDLVDENFGYRPTTPIEGLLTVLEKELPGALSPPLQSITNGDAGDYTVACSGCGEEMDEPHTWPECNAALKSEVDKLDGAWWAVLGELQEVAFNAAEPEEAARAAVAEIARLRTELSKMQLVVHAARWVSNAATESLTSGALGKPVAALQLALEELDALFQEKLTGSEVTP